MKRFLSIVLSLCMLMSVVPAFAAEYTADDDTVVYISFDEELPEGSTGYNLSVLNEGVYGNCAWFNGSTSYIHLPNNITDGVEDFTMAAWIKSTTSTDAWRRIFDLGNGTGNYAFLGIPSDGTATTVRGAVKVNNGSEWNVTATNTLVKDKWVHVAFVKEGTVGKIYVNGNVAATNTGLASTPDAMGATATNYIGRSQFSGDKYLKAYLDELVFAKRAFSDDEIKAMGTFPEAVLDEEAVLNAIDIPVKDSVKENITLQKEALGYSVTWESSDEDVVYPYDIPNGDYTIPAGKVTRQAEDTVVTLTATVDFNGQSLTKDIDVNIIAKPEPVGETEAYLYVYFRGEVNKEPENQQIHLASSEDGYVWKDLNGNWPILESNLGTQHLRDPYLLRSKDGDRFYMIATDLTCQDGQGWGPWSLEGSKYLMVWESDDLVNWSEQRMVKFANDDMGCAWAPEAIWDPDTEEYLVYASAKDLTLASPKDTVFVVRTRDFRTFSEPEYFVAPTNANGGRIEAIDSNIIQGNDGRFYHFYKHNAGEINMLVSDHAAGPYEEVPGYQSVGGEGPGSFLVKGTDDTYALMVDNYSVYIPYLTTDLASGKFTKATETIIMPTGSKHGGFLPVNAEEYARVLEKWDNPEVDAEGTAAKYVFDFEEDSSAYLNGNAKVEYSEERQSKVLVLDGTNSYFEFPEGIFDRQSTFTLSFDVKNDNSASNNMTFSLGTGDKYYYFYKINDTTMRSALTITSWQYEEKAISNDLGNLTDTWMHIDLVVEPDTITIYKDAVQVAQNSEMTKSIYHLATEGLSAYLGKSMYSADPYFKGEFDNVALYYRALTPAEIVEGVGGSTDEDMAKLDAEAVNFGYDVTNVTGNITIPDTGVYGSAITWEISDESVIAPDGTVSVPAAGEDDKIVKLTGTFEYGKATVVKEYFLTVRPVTSLIVSSSESAWKTYTIPTATDKVTYKFNIRADKETDGVVAFAASTTTPSAYGHYRMLVRVQPSGADDGVGVFDAYNGTGYAKTEVVNYEVGKTYPITVEVDVVNKKYSVYVDVDGATHTIADNFSFRASGQGNDIGKLTVCGGYGMAAGLVTVTDFTIVDEESEEPTTDEPTSDEPTSDEPTTDEPTSDEPTSDEPTTDEPTSDEPTTDEPTTDEPTTDEPTSDEPTSDEPTSDEPTSDEPTTDEPTSDEPTTDEPTTDEPTSDEPTTDEPTSDEPTTDEPTSDEPTSDEPTSDEPTTDEPTSDEPTTDEPTTDEPTSDEPTSDEPTSDEPTTDEPTTDEPTSDEPTTDEPTSDEPTSDEPTSDEPTSDEPTTDEPTTDEPTTDEPSEEPGDEPSEGLTVEDGYVLEDDVTNPVNAAVCSSGLIIHGTLRVASDAEADDIPRPTETVVVLITINKNGNPYMVSAHTVYVSADGKIELPTDRLYVNEEDANITIEAISILRGTNASAAVLGTDYGTVIGSIK